MSFNIGDDMIDSRELIERIDVLERDEESLDEDEKEELAMLLAFQAEAEPYCSDWQDGAALVHERYFVDYCREQLEDCGYLPKDLPWWIAIDWEATASNMSQDYTEVELQGHTYLVR